jgi:hypothetical protein
LKENRKIWIRKNKWEKGESKRLIGGRGNEGRERVG